MSTPSTATPVTATERNGAAWAGDAALCDRLRSLAALAWRRWLGPAALACTLLITGCDNNPHARGSERSNTLFTAFQERSPRYLDPTASYSNNETPITYQVYEPLYGYHYLKRPYVLEPKTAEAVVAPRYLDAQGRALPENAPGAQVAQSVYELPIRRGVKYAPHPALATDDQGHYLYHALSAGQTAGKHSPFDFPVLGTRELVAEDFVYALKRHATPRIEAPIFGIFSEYVLGLKDYALHVRQEDQRLRAGLSADTQDLPFLDFRQWPLEGAEAPNPHLLRIRLKGKYPQWKYWMAMTFLAPVPWEADKFYAQPGMARNGLQLQRWPVGTGPYMLREYEQDRRHVLVRNPNYRAELYPCEGESEDKARGLLADCGQRMPFIERIEFSNEKEKVPLKTKFLQGYLDVPEVERVDWGPDLLADMNDSEALRQQLNERGFQFPKTVDLSLWYFGFNMLDPVVGHGDSPEQGERNRKLRQAISIAIDWEEGYGRVFLNKAGEAAHSPLPAGLFGSRHGTPEGFNPVTHHKVDGRVQRRSIEEARALMVQAGYPDGRDARTGRPLVLNYDFQRAPTPEIRAELDWMIRQFAKLGIQLEIRATDFNQYQEKIRRGRHQLFWAGWLADYPDAENFLFLLYGPNAKSRHDGENIANYENPAYDRLYRQLQLLDDGPQKQKLIDDMVNLLREDAPWSFGYLPYAAGAYPAWLHNGKPSILLRDMLRYQRLDTGLRARRIREWNQARPWPLAFILLAIVALAAWAWQVHRRRERAPAIETA